MSRGRFCADTSLERFWLRVQRNENGCWEWRGYRNHEGYGRFRGSNQRKTLVHRFSYELAHGKIGDGLVLDHLCRNPSCVNPEHLEPVTNRENQARGLINQNVRKTHCSEGHPLSGKNLYIHKTTHERACRRCQARWQSEYRARKRAQLQLQTTYQE